MGVGLLLLLVLTLAVVKIETIRGNQIGVLETWSGGVINKPLLPKTYIFLPGFNKKVFPYDINQQVFVMNDKQDFAEGRALDSYLVQSAEGQDMRISLNVQWRRDPEKVIELHKTVRDAIEERLIRPEIMRVVKDEATRRSALEAYSGDGLVTLQRDISNRLTDLGTDLRARGIIVDNFVIEHIGLDPEYVKEIKQRQVAVQARLRNIEETKAAEAAAEKAKATAQADFEKSVVEAKRDKEVGILSAEKQAQQEVLAATAAAKKVELAAEAEKNRNVAIAEGEKEAGFMRAEAIKAVGAAEAEATKLKLLAYSAEGAEAFVRIQVSDNMARAFENIKGYLPENMNINLLTDQYIKGVSLLVNPTQTTETNAK